MKTIERPNKQYAHQAAEVIFEMAKEGNETVETEWNGAPMKAHPGDASPDLAYLRWHYERLLIQIADGTVDVRDYADDRFTRK